MGVGLACALGAACGSQDGPRGAAVDVAAPIRPGAASPEAAVTDLIAHLRRNDLAAIPRIALPPALHARADAEWRTGRMRWPLVELPLDDRIPGLLSALSAPNAERTLQARFHQQLSGQTKALQDAARGLGQFGQQYLRHEGDYSAQERQHYIRVLGALSAWAQRAPLGDQSRGRQAIHLLTVAAARTGLQGGADLDRLGMTASLKGLTPLYIAIKQVFGLYGLGLDETLAGLRAERTRQTGDQAWVKVSYRLAGKPVETELAAVRIEGRWYLVDYVKAIQVIDPAAVEAASGGPSAPARDGADHSRPASVDGPRERGGDGKAG